MNPQTGVPELTCMNTQDYESHRSDVGESGWVGQGYGRVKQADWIEDGDSMGQGLRMGTLLLFGVRKYFAVWADLCTRMLSTSLASTLLPPSQPTVRAE